jgi:hypothetical protein
LSQTNQIVLVVFQKFVSYRVSKQVGMNLHADDRSILVAQSSDATVGQCSSLPNEDVLAFNGRAGFKVRLQSTPGWDSDKLQFRRQ